MIENFNQFSRLFVFGCSYTTYLWPTWADILSKEINNSKFYNLAKIGSGNLLISLRIAEANKRFKFDKNDLVIIMWSSCTREDRYINQKWLSTGNIFNQGVYSDSWVKQFADPDGYLIRDYALIELTKKYLDNLSCTSLMLTAYPLDLVEFNSMKTLFTPEIYSTCCDLYSDTLKNIPISLQSWIQNKVGPDNNFTSFGHAYLVEKNSLIKDGHINPKWQYLYLKDLGFPLTEKSETYALKAQALLEQCKTIQQLNETFTECKQTFIKDMF